MGLIEAWMRLPPTMSGPNEDAIARHSPQHDCVDEFFPAGPRAVSRRTGSDVDVAWHRPKGGALYAHTERCGDVVASTHVDDRWFLGALGILSTRRELLLDLFVSDDNAHRGLFTFRFYKNGEWCEVTVDSALPCEGLDDAGAPVGVAFGQSADRYTLWPALMTKAYAKLHGSYDALAPSLDPAVDATDALVDLTGGAGRTLRLRHADQNDTWERLLRYHEYGYLVGASATADEARAVPAGVPEGEVGEGEAGAAETSAEASAQSADVDIGAGRAPDEGCAYGVVDVVECSNGVRLVRLRDPWGVNPWRGDWSIESPQWHASDNAGLLAELEYELADDGTFWMSYGDFLERFDALHVCRIFPADWHQLVLKGLWTGASAGGPPTLPDGRASASWGKNPQYRLVVQHSCEVLVSLLQRDERVESDEGSDPPAASRQPPAEVGVVVLRCGREERGRKWRVEEQDVVRASPPSSARETTLSLQLDAAFAYVIVPYTSRAGCQAPFVLRTFSSAPVEVERLTHPYELRCLGRWTETTSGGNKSQGTFGSNPQYVVAVERETQAVIQVTRLDLGDDPDPPGGRGAELGVALLKPAGGAAAAASVYRYTVGGHASGGRSGGGAASEAPPARCLAVSPGGAEIVGEGDFTSTREGIYFATLTPEHPHLLVPSAVRPGAVVAPYVITVCSAQKVHVLEFPEAQAAVLNGQWSKEGGGCNLNPTWGSNPKFLLTVSEPGSFKVTLSVDGGQWKRGKSLDKMIGFCVFASARADGKIAPERKAVLHETSYVPMKEVSLDLELGTEPEPRYVIMPTLYAPNIAGKFTISVTSETRFTFAAV